MIAVDLAVSQSLKYIGPEHLEQNSVCIWPKSPTFRYPNCLACNFVRGRTEARLKWKYNIVV